MSIPNLITLGRILLVPVVVWAIASGAMLTAFVLFLVAGVSDAVDGYLAKRFKMASELGAYLDPLADKALIVSIYVTLGIAGTIPRWLVILVVSRDIMIVGAVMLSWVIGSPLKVKPLVVSKLNTAAQIVFACVLLGSLGFNVSATYRLVQALAEHSLLARERDGRSYGVGGGLVALAATVMQRVDLPEVALPAMERLRELTSETVSVYVRHGRHRICVALLEGLHPMRWVVPVGDRQPLVAPRGFDADADEAFERPQPRNQRRDPGFVIAERKALAQGRHMHIQPPLAHIHPNGDLHLVPSLPNRARAPAAPATVRDQWIDAGRPALTYGLCRPGGLQAAPHHRNSILTR